MENWNRWRSFIYTVFSFYRHIILLFGDFSNIKQIFLILEKYLEFEDSGC